MFILYHFTFWWKIMPESTRRFKLPQKFFSSLLLNFWPLLMIFQSGACKMNNHRRGGHRLFPQFTVPPPLPKHMPIGTHILFHIDIRQTKNVFFYNFRFQIIFLFWYMYILLFLSGRILYVGI